MLARLSRTLASMIFLCSRCLALGAVIYAPSVALSAILGIDTMVAVFIIGALTTTYTLVGGVSAVIWTDVKQMTVILVGLVIVFGGGRLCLAPLARERRRRRG